MSYVIELIVTKQQVENGTIYVVVSCQLKPAITWQDQALDETFPGKDGCMTAELLHLPLGDFASGPWHVRTSAKTVSG